jgi:hypothetical protein
VSYKLLDAFRKVFEGQVYKHRDSTIGDGVAQYLYEDLYDLNRSAKLVDRVAAHRAVINVQNRVVGREARRGDGTFGEIVPGVLAVAVPGFHVARGRIAAVEIGAETKILFKAMIKQIDRVISTLQGQVVEFKRSSPRAICVGIVGVNYAAQCSSFEGPREYPTDGRTRKHPIQEAADAEGRVRAEAGPHFDELIVLPFRATNQLPFPFEWVDGDETAVQYGASLARISREYEVRT